MASYIRTEDHLTVVFDDGEIETIYQSNPNYDDIITAINKKDWDTVRELADPAVEVKRAIETSANSDRVRIKGGVVYYDDQPLHNHLTDRMIEMVNEGFDIAPLAAFLQNLMENPSFRAVNELYGFLEASNLPITEDGHFLAYKRIRTNWRDQWSGTVDNSIGTHPKMPRNEVDEDANRTCSRGLHFCSRSYLSKYGSRDGGRVVVVKINPRDVVAIPNDYNNEKGRCCEYEVINEIKLVDKKNTAEPKAELEGVYRHSGKTDSVDRSLVQFNLETGQTVATYKTPSEAMKMTGIDSSGISKVARGVRNSAGGYGWRYDEPKMENAQSSLGALFPWPDNPEDAFPDDDLWK